jgi:putative N6-adenine-specific DNA methylase
MIYTSNKYTETNFDGHNKRHFDGKPHFAKHRHDRHQPDEYTDEPQTSSRPKHPEYHADAQGNQQYTAICQRGLENVLADELAALGANVTAVSRSTVFFTGDNYTLYKANMALRSAVNILRPLKRIIAHDYDMLYFQAKKINWHKMFGIDKTIRIDVKGSSEELTHSQYVIHRIKDAILDTQRKFNDGQRPSVDKDNPDIHVVAYLTNRDVTLYLDSSGTPLFKRGYREDTHFAAPLKEELAAGLLELSGWDGKTDVLDICCGSGTLLIEAALLATHTPPNLHRRFSFQNWSDFDEAAYKRAKNDLQKQIIPSDIKLTGYEIDRFTAKKATEIIRSLKLDKMITIINDDFRHCQHKYENAIIITNPPYGQRLESDDEEKVFALYKDIGDFLKHNCATSMAYIFTGNFEAMKHIGLRTSRRIEVWNGPIECRLLEIKCY